MNKEYNKIEKQALLDLFKICAFLKIFYKAKQKFNRKIIKNNMLNEFSKLNDHSLYPKLTYMMLFDIDYEEEINKIIFQKENSYEYLRI
jgi:hypothetical protein